MYDAIFELSPYAPLVIFIASVLDIFFITGYILYGGATLGAVGILYTTGMITIPEIIIAALTGTLLGNQINYWTGRFFHTTVFVQNRLISSRAQKASGFLRSHGLLTFMIIGRFVTFFRPIHGLIIGAFNIKLYRFVVYDIFLSLFWVCFWLAVLLIGEEMLRQIFR